jgi:hypothetical protein
VQGSNPQTYTIAEILKWNDDKELDLNPKFQRGTVWSAPARSYLIDSILRGYPIPKLLFRTVVDRSSRRTLRDVVDGQQRLRTIIDFASDKFALGTKAGEEFRTQRYSDLSPDIQDGFLAYKLTCEQLLNASDEDFLEIFVRINSYTVPVNAAELRNERFDNEFSAYVKGMIRRVPTVWKAGVLSPRDRVRMIDQSLIAEVVGFFETGVVEGAESDIDKVYSRNKDSKASDLPPVDSVIDAMETAAGFLVDELFGEAIAQRPHFLMLVAAVMYAKGVLPPGRLSFDKVPSPSSLLKDPEKIVECLVELNSALGADIADLPTPLVEFVDARTSTQRMKSRQPRFEHFCRALAGSPVIQ